MLSSEDKEKFDWLLDELVKRNSAIIVEGKKDRAALENLGVCNSIFVLNKRPLFEIAETIAGQFNDAVILTDLDSEGKKLYGKLNTFLQQLGVRVDTRIREFLFKNTRIRQVEALSALRQP